MSSSFARDHGTAGAAARAKHYETCHRETTIGGGQGIVFSAAGAQPPPPPPPGRRPRRRHSSSASARRSSTTVVATDVGNFRAMVQELTGFPPAAIFRPLPRRAHSASAGQYLAAALQPGQGQYNSSAAAGSGSSSTSPEVSAAAVVQPSSQYCCATPGVFDGLADLGSPGFDAWPELCFE